MVVIPNTNTESSIKDFWTLLKPSVMSLAIFTSFIAAVVAPGHIHFIELFAAVLSIAVGAGGAGALNMWYERHTDKLMKRTHGRPLPRGRLEAQNALALGVILSIVGILFLGIATNWWAALWLFISIFFYVIIYTVWLKPRTPQNIVIGGAAGALPPVIGWAAVSPQFSWYPVIMFLIIFLWTPPHFWALAILRKEDYAKANFPMLPNIKGKVGTIQSIMLYIILTIFASFFPYFMGYTGIGYLIGAVGLGLPFLYFSYQMTHNVKKYGGQVFGYSILYLFALFSLMFIDYIWS
jgi:protoheme IX farnesyltransferase